MPTLTTSGVLDGQGGRLTRAESVGYQSLYRTVTSWLPDTSVIRLMAAVLGGRNQSAQQHEPLQSFET